MKYKIILNEENDRNASVTRRLMTHSPTSYGPYVSQRTIISLTRRIPLLTFQLNGQLGLHGTWYCISEQSSVLYHSYEIVAIERNLRVMWKDMWMATSTLRKLSRNNTTQVWSPWLATREIIGSCSSIILTLNPVFYWNTTAHRC